MVEEEEEEENFSLDEQSRARRSQPLVVLWVLQTVSLGCDSALRKVRVSSRR